MSLRAAINQFCRSCIYDPRPGNGHWRQQVSACTAVTCPLYPVRPKSSASGEPIFEAETDEHDEGNALGCPEIAEQFEEETT